MNRALFLAVILVAYPAGAGAQAPRELHFNMTSSSTVVPKELTVDDWTRVRVTVTKNMFHSCTVETKTEALPPPPNPIAQILGVLGPFVGGAAPERVAAERADAGLEAQIEALAKDAEAVVGQVKKQIGDVEVLVKDLPRRVACGVPTEDQEKRKEDVCVDRREAQSRLESIAEDLQGTPETPIVSTTLLSARAAELSKLLIGRMAQEKGGENDWLKNAFARLRWAQETIDYAAERRAALVKARDALLVIRERILGFAPSTEAVYPLSPSGNARTTATVSCVNIVTQQPAIYTEQEGTNLPPTIERLAPVSAPIIFRDVPWATVSGGLLYSRVDKRQIAIAAHSTGIDQSGVVTFDRRVVETGTGRSQMVPFTYFNAVIPGISGRRTYWAGSVGFGLNPNNGPKTLEYFLGGALGISRFVVINFGAHIGTRMEPANEFAVGNVLPAALTAVPTRRERDTGFALGVSYGLPLPK